MRYPTLLAAMALTTSACGLELDRRGNPPQTETPPSYVVMPRPPPTEPVSYEPVPGVHDPNYVPDPNAWQPPPPAAAGVYTCTIEVPDVVRQTFTATVSQDGSRTVRLDATDLRLNLGRTVTEVGRNDSSVPHALAQWGIWDEDVAAKEVDVYWSTALDPYTLTLYTTVGGEYATHYRWLTEVYSSRDCSYTQ